MSIKRKILNLIRKAAGTGYVTADDIKRRGGGSRTRMRHLY